MKKRRWKKNVSFITKHNQKKFKKMGITYEVERSLMLQAFSPIDKKWVPTTKGQATRSEMWSNKREGMAQSTFTKC
jgi:hypothetical protein